ncbi:uncharacterized protein FLJ37310-like [Phocoena sinus]|uniref:uncharacterized protein FLJ37310-like n=1 Tax=Phocoena sinus TaxID=42100 RepID=UPI0013C471A8|nr:uncharacterized protein FLJ37310-like [Phocoena sinus]
MPTFSGQLRSHLPPSSRRGGGGRCKTLPVALHEGGGAERCGSNLPSRPRRPRRPRSALPPTPCGPFQTPWARGCCSVRKRWPRLGPARRGSKRGGGGAPGTVSPATGRGRARRDAGSSRSTAGARRRRWQRESRDLSITGSHGARAFSSLWAGASARHTSSGRKGPAPEPPRRAAGRALAPTMRAALVLFLCSRFVRTPLLPRSGREGAAGGGGDSFLGGVGGQRGCCSDCSRRRSKERELLLQEIHLIDGCHSLLKCNSDMLFSTVFERKIGSILMN